MDPAAHNESRTYVPIVVVVVTLTVATTAVVLRTYTRRVIIKQFGYDDIGAIISLLLAIGCGVAIGVNSRYGAGHHVWTLDLPRITKYLRTLYVSIVLYNFSLTAVKFTFLAQYYRVFGVRTMRTVIIIAAVFVGCWTLSQVLIAVFTCKPISKFWDLTVLGSCMPSVPFWYINAAGNIVTDATIFVLPLPVLRKLNLPRSQKVVLIGIFSIGFFTCAMSLIRLKFLHVTDDITWNNVDLSCWSIAELCSAVTCVCLPVLKPFFSRLLPNLGWTSHHRSSDRQHYTLPDGPHSHRSGAAAAAAAATATADSHKLSKSDSQRTFFSKSHVLHLEEEEEADLELQRGGTRGGGGNSTDGDGGDYAGPILGLEDLQRKLEFDRASSAASSGAAAPPPFFPAAETTTARLQLGLQPTVTTEIKAGTPEPAEAAARAVPERGIAVHRDVVVDPA